MNHNPKPKLREMQWYKKWNGSKNDRFLEYKRTRGGCDKGKILVVVICVGYHGQGVYQE
jgi:hypothetical protein